MEFVSCGQSNPFVRLDGETANASVLNYNLPATTSFSVRRFVPVSVPDSYWRDDAFVPPSDEENPFKAPEKTPTWEEPVRGSASGGSIVDRLKAILAEAKWVPPGAPQEFPQPDFQIVTAITQPLINDLAIRVASMRSLLGVNTAQAAREATYRKVALSDEAETDLKTTIPTAVTAKTRSASYNGQELITNLLHGKLPVAKRSLYGDMRYRYVSEPKPVKPALFVIEEMEVASFLGNYGAGRTVKTFSLLPGERTNISIKTWRSDEQLKSKASNILDSFEQTSADELEGMIESETSNKTEAQDTVESGFSNTHTDNSTSTGKGGGGLGIDIGIFSIGGSGEYSETTTTEDANVSTGSTSSSRGNAASSVAKAMDRHVNQSSTARKLEVNTETKEELKTTTGEEQTITRELQNINYSRVLNFVFRQLTQEYITITYLRKVTVGFTKGYPGDGKEADLDGVDRLLATVLKPERVSEIRNLIINELSGVFDHTGTAVSFVERVDESFQSITTPSKTIERSYFRKRQDLAQMYKGKTVPGIIIHTATRILNTDALFVEALLGQGEAIDCYNMRLQAAAADKADLANVQQRVAVETVEGVPSPEHRPDAYRTVFGPCCDKQNQKINSQTED